MDPIQFSPSQGFAYEHFFLAQHRFYPRSLLADAKVLLSFFMGTKSRFSYAEQEPGRDKGDSRYEIEKVNLPNSYSARRIAAEEAEKETGKKGRAKTQCETLTFIPELECAKFFFSFPVNVHLDIACHLFQTSRQFN